LQNCLKIKTESREEGTNLLEYFSVIPDKKDERDRFEKEKGELNSSIYYY